MQFKVTLKEEEIYRLIENEVRTFLEMPTAEVRVERGWTKPFVEALVIFED